MRVTLGQLRGIIRQNIREASHQHSVPWKKGEVVEIIRPVRVTPIAHGDWADMDTRGAHGYEGGEDSPRSRKPTRPRGITATILKPGTQARINYATSNEASVTPIGPDGETIVDEKTGNPLEDVRIHVNKVCPECAGEYTTRPGGGANVPASMRRGKAPPPSVALAAAKPKPAGADPRDAEIAKLKKMLAALGHAEEPAAGEEEEPADFGEI